MANSQVAYGPCGRCGLVHGSWQPCPDNLNAAERLIALRGIVTRVRNRLVERRWISRDDIDELERAIGLLPDIEP